MNIAVYVTADNNYVEYAIIALKSFHRFFPDLDFFIVTDQEALTNENRELLQKHSIEILNGEWYKDFSTKVQKWPPIVFAMLEGPELLFQRGYQYSIGLDADVICLRAFDLDAIIRSTKNFSGIANQVNIFSNFPDREYMYGFLKEVHGQDFEANRVERLVNPNTGVIFWNNVWASEFNLCAKAKFCYDNLKDILVAVDQSLLAAVFAAYKLKYNIIDYEFNYRLNNPYDQKIPRMKEQAKIVHFTGPKPWRDYPFTSIASLFGFFRQRTFRKEWALARQELYGGKSRR